MALLPLSPASAATTEPTVLVKLRSVTFDAYTGNVTVTARVACSDADAGTWSARLVQDVRARGAAAITCDGEKRRSRIVLDPAKGRFHSGPAELTYGGFACADTSCVVVSASESVILTHSG
jgi:hypothetical protein